MSSFGVRLRYRAQGLAHGIGQEESLQREAQQGGERLQLGEKAAAIGVETCAVSLSWTWRKLSFRV